MIIKSTSIIIAKNTFIGIQMKSEFENTCF